MALESSFQSGLIRKFRDEFGWFVLKNDPNYIQGIPDLLILSGRRWAALETKRSSTSSSRFNQGYYINLLDKMSFGRFINPENAEEVISELQKSLRSGR